MLDPTTALIAAIRGQFYAGLAAIKREAGMGSDAEFQTALRERDQTDRAARAAGIAPEAFLIIPGPATRLEIVPAGNGLYRLARS